MVGDSHRYGGIGRIDQRGCCNIGAVPRAVGCNGHKVEMEPCLGLAMALTRSASIGLAIERGIRGFRIRPEEPARAKVVVASFMQPAAA